MKPLSKEQFEEILNKLCIRLNADCKKKGPFTKAVDYENRARAILVDLLINESIKVNLSPHPHIFPDIVLGSFGIEVKFTTNDSWRSIANSVFESTRDEGVKDIYVLFGKMGGTPESRWGKYDDCVIHVRTSHVPRFEVEMLSRESLFNKMGISYLEFSQLPIEERMTHIRKYARSRLKEGERLWWLEDRPGEAHTLPINVRLYMRLPQEEKRRLRAEAALLCPQVVASSRSRNKYTDVTMYLLTYHGVLCPQARDLFSAGSVALRADGTRGGNYLARALADIESEMREAAVKMDTALFVEYWGAAVPPKNRISEWLKRADELATDWTPSEVLFRKKR